MEPKPNTPQTPDTVYNMSDWGANSQKDYPYIKNNAANFGYDAAKMTQGFLLSTIIQDDGNAFGRLYVDHFDTAEARQAQTDLLNRLHWETGLEELPEKMKEMISKTKLVIERSDWAVQAGFESSKTAYAIMRERVSAQVELDENLKSSYSYYNNAFLYDPEFNKFMDARPKDNTNVDNQRSEGVA